jgi:hypothetical protein
MAAMDDLDYAVSQQTKPEDKVLALMNAIALDLTAALAVGNLGAIQQLVSLINTDGPQLSRKIVGAKTPAAAASGPANPAATGASGASS